jgi:hypothetical protein
MGATAMRTLRAQAGERAGRWLGNRAHVVDSGNVFFSPSSWITNRASLLLRQYLLFLSRSVANLTLLLSTFITQTTSCSSRSYLWVQEPGIPVMAAAAQLEDVPNESLFSELLRRMKCAPKPEKRIILVGTSRFCPELCVCSHLFCFFFFCSMIQFFWGS